MRPEEHKPNSMTGSVDSCRLPFFTTATMITESPAGYRLAVAHRPSTCILTSLVLHARTFWGFRGRIVTSRSEEALKNLCSAAITATSCQLTGTKTCAYRRRKRKSKMRIKNISTRHRILKPNCHSLFMTFSGVSHLRDLSFFLAVSEHFHANPESHYSQICFPSRSRS